MNPGDLVKFTWATGSWIGLVVGFDDLIMGSHNVTIWRPGREEVQTWSLACYRKRIEVLSESR